MWSLGICLFAMGTSRFPFEEANEKDQRFRVYTAATKKGVSPLRALIGHKAHGTQLTDELIDLLEGMLTINPRQRLTLEQAGWPS